jgi:hypothetical protein
MPPRSQTEKRLQRQKQIEALGAFSATAQGIFGHAWELFISGDDEKRTVSEKLAAKLLRQAQLGHLHKAGCHLLLAHGPDKYV